MPRQVEGIDAIEEPEEIRFTPNNLLSSDPQSKRDRFELEIEIELPQLVVRKPEVAPPIEWNVSDAPDGLAGHVVEISAGGDIVDGVVNAAVEGEEAHLFQPWDRRPIRR